MFEKLEENREDKRIMVQELNLSVYFKSIIDQDRCAVVICNLEHEIIYLNAAAATAYRKWGGNQLLGKNLLNCHNADSQEMIKKVVSWFAESKDNNLVYTVHQEKQNKDVYMVALRNEDGELIGYYEKHEYRNAETAERGIPENKNGADQ
jgi:transcriptional regulator with PAS, ATPase and Fis domain